MTFAEIADGLASIDVSGRDPRGVKIQSGDEIYFGRASVKVTIRPAG